MEDNKKDVLNNQPKKEEKEKKNKFLVWWLGLGKWARVGICAGAAAVLATAITLPIVLTQKNGGKTPESFSGEVTELQWKEALSTSISYGDKTNFTCTIHDTYDEEHDTTIKMVGKNVLFHFYQSNNYYDRYEFEDDYGYWSKRSNNDDYYEYNNSVTEQYYYQAHFSVLYSNNSNFSNFSFDSTAKEYKLNKPKNYGGPELRSIKFKDEKHIDIAVVVDTGSGDTKTYTFEYGNAAIDSSKITPNNIYALAYNDQEGTYSSQHTVGLYAMPYYLVDVSKFSSFATGTNTLKCSHNSFTQQVSIAKVEVYIDKVETVGATYDSANKKFANIGNVSATSKVVLTLGDENESDATGFKAEVK